MIPSALLAFPRRGRHRKSAGGRRGDGGEMSAPKKWSSVERVGHDRITPAPDSGFFNAGLTPAWQNFATEVAHTVSIWATVSWGDGSFMHDRRGGLATHARAPKR